MWNDILGNPRAKSFLEQYLQAENRPHALLFLGPKGVGIRQLALRFAKSILCHQLSEQDDCESCRRLNFATGNLTHPDFIWIKKEINEKNGKYKDISIEQIRQLIEASRFAPVLSTHKVCIIEDFDTASEAAVNSLLKLLEEPPQGWIILLQAENENLILPTILSRVVTLRFSGASEKEVLQILGQRFPELPSKKQLVLARLSEGRIGAALAMQQQDIWSYREQVQALLEALPLSYPIGYLSTRSWPEKFTKEQALCFIHLLMTCFRDMLLIKANAKAKLFHPDLEQELTFCVHSWKIIPLKKTLVLLNNAYQALLQNANVKQVLENIVLNIDKLSKE